MHQNSSRQIPSEAETLGDGNTKRADRIRFMPDPNMQTILEDPDEELEADELHLGPSLEVGVGVTEDDRALPLVQG